jgi:hypothetical protein
LARGGARGGGVPAPPSRIPPRPARAAPPPGDPRPPPFAARSRPPLAPPRAASVPRGAPPGAEARRGQRACGDAGGAGAAGGALQRRHHLEVGVGVAAALLRCRLALQHPVLALQCRDLGLQRRLPRLCCGLGARRLLLRACDRRLERHDAPREAPTAPELLVQLHFVPRAPVLRHQQRPLERKVCRHVHRGPARLAQRREPQPRGLRRRVARRAGGCDGHPHRRAGVGHLDVGQGGRPPLRWLGEGERRGRPDADHTRWPRPVLAPRAWRRAHVRWLRERKERRHRRAQGRRLQPRRARLAPESCPRRRGDGAAG